jgi:hypothetical protein
MDAHPEIDRDRLYDIQKVERTYQEDYNAPKEPPAQFCGNECRQEYRSERISGVIQSQTNINGQVVSHRQKCAQMKLCAYCETKLV